MLTMEDLYQSKAVLVIGNDPTNQNPLVAWQIRSGIRHFNSKLFVINAADIKLKRQGASVRKSCGRHRRRGHRWLAHGQGNLAPETVEQLVNLKAALEAESRCGDRFRRGSFRRGHQPSRGVWFETPWRTFATWRSAITPIRAALRTWACCPTACPDTRTWTTRKARETLEQVWGGVIPSKAGMTAPEMVEAAQSGKLKALYVMGANPLAHYGTLGYGRGKADLLIVHEMFLTETAKQADIVFPAASAYEKDGTVTNTAGEIQSRPQRRRNLGTALRLRSVAHPFSPTRKAWTRQSLSL